jgi:hypothetical protein
MEGLVVLTARRVRDITSPSSWRPASADNRYWAKLPENPANTALSGQNGLLINGQAEKKIMSEIKQTTPAGKDHPSGYKQLLEQVLATAPQVGKALVRAHENRIKELNRYLNEDTLRKHFPGSYFVGLEEVYYVLDAIREAYERGETLKDIAFLVKRVRADFESAVDASLAGFNGVVFDIMRDVMEVGYLLRDFLHGNQQIRKWLKADRATLLKDFGPAALRRRHAAVRGTVPEKLPDAFDYRLHSEGLQEFIPLLIDGPTYGSQL